MVRLLLWRLVDKIDAEQVPRDEFPGTAAADRNRATSGQTKNRWSEAAVEKIKALLYGVPRRREGKVHEPRPLHGYRGNPSASPESLRDAGLPHPIAGSAAIFVSPCATVAPLWQAGAASAGVAWWRGAPRRTANRSVLVGPDPTHDAQSYRLASVAIGAGRSRAGWVR